jgi:phage repressor protein C with HTH and peptisase S24 domain
MTVKQFRQSLKLTQEAFSTMVGVSRAFISNIERGEEKVSSKVRQAIIDQYGIELIDDPEVQKSSDSKPDYNAFQVDIQDIGPIKGSNMAIVGIAAQAGFAQSFESDPEIERGYRYHRYNRDVIAFEVAGDSMEGTFFAGDLAICLRESPMQIEDIKEGYIYVIVLKDGICIKRVFLPKGEETPDHIIAFSDNYKDHPPKTINGDEIQRFYRVYSRDTRNLTRVEAKFIPLDDIM